ncbi:hypothetical protein BHE74_00027779 [Ensete ventricosum]|nr:hypothetical protein BHE74_00027779 [Ensete ventricosum]
MNETLSSIYPETKPRRWVSEACATVLKVALPCSERKKGIDVYLFKKTTLGPEHAVGPSHHPDTVNSSRGIAITERSGDRLSCDGQGNAGITGHRAVCEGPLPLANVNGVFPGIFGTGWVISGGGGEPLG